MPRQRHAVRAGLGSNVNFAGLSRIGLERLPGSTATRSAARARLTWRPPSWRRNTIARHCVQSLGSGVQAWPRDTGSARPLFVSHTGQLGGAELVLLDVVSGFGAAASVFLLERGALGDALAARGTSVVCANSGRNLALIKRDRSLVRALLYAAPLIGAIREIMGHARRHDVVYANSQKAFVLAAMAGVPCTHGRLSGTCTISCPPRIFGAAQRKLAVGLANRFAARVIVPSAEAADAFTDGGGRPGLVRLVPNGLDLPSDLEDPQALRARIRASPGFSSSAYSAAWLPGKGSTWPLTRWRALPERQMRDRR